MDESSASASSTTAGKEEEKKSGMKRPALTRSNSYSPSVQSRRRLLAAAAATTTDVSADMVQAPRMVRNHSSPARSLSQLILDAETAVPEARPVRQLTQAHVDLPPSLGNGAGAGMAQPPPPKPPGLLKTLIRSTSSKNPAKQDQVLLDRAVRYFNLNISIGTKFYKEEILGLTNLPRGGEEREEAGEEDEANMKFARFLKTTLGISKVKLGQALARNKLLRQAFLNTFDFSSFPPTCAGVEQAFRYFLTFFKLPGEGQEIDRILESFSHQFHLAHAQALALDAQDTTHQFLFLIILLNVNLNNRVAAASMRPMTKRAFCDCYAPIICNHTVGLSVSVEELGQMYDSVKQAPIVFVPDRDQLAGNLFANPDMSGWLRINTITCHTPLNLQAYSLGQTRFVLLAENSLYVFKNALDTDFDMMIPLENLRVFIEAPPKPRGARTVWNCCSQRVATARTRFKLVLFPREPLRHIKIGRLSKRDGIRLEMVSSIALKTNSRSEFDCWVSVLRQKGLGRSQTYSVLSPASHTQQQQQQQHHPYGSGILSKSSWSATSGTHASNITPPGQATGAVSTPTPRYFGFAELQEVMENYPEDEPSSSSSPPPLPHEEAAIPSSPGQLATV